MYTSAEPQAAGGAHGARGRKAQLQTRSWEKQFSVNVGHCGGAYKRSRDRRQEQTECEKAVRRQQVGGCSNLAEPWTWDMSSGRAEGCWQA